ncbi:hypothetical protein J4218_04995 [Candidatus Pacearchaeota archaeon]|nr:hypothetical protein [Candidatus Pacearchaeota archaeon]
MEDEIFKISKDISRAKDLFQISKERLEIIEILPKDKTYKIIEEYYEIFLELMTVIMYLDGYKTLSHIKVLEYVSQKYNILSNNQVQTIDTLRKFRHGIVYYGKKVSNEYLINHQEEITEIIKSLDNLVESKLKNEVQ